MRIKPIQTNPEQYVCATAEATKFRYSHGQRQLQYDQIIIEQPLQIRLTWQAQLNGAISSQIFSITMRTPGEDKALIIGLLRSEGVIERYQQIESIAAEVDVSDSVRDSENLWEVRLRSGERPNLKSQERFQLTYSSCGLCGSTSLQALELKNPPQLPMNKHWLHADIICTMPELMREQQKLFTQTGGVHAAALFNAAGVLLDIKEDIGRHNAVDKLLGQYLVANENVHDQTQNNCLLVSGRVSFEIVQKSVMAGVAVLIAVGAPSELAVQAAKRFNLTLIGFTTKNGFNLYHGDWRLLPLEEKCQKT